MKMDLVRVGTVQTSRVSIGRQGVPLQYLLSPANLGSEPFAFKLLRAKERPPRGSSWEFVPGGLCIGTCP